MAEDYANAVCLSWKAGVFNSTDRLGVITYSISQRVCMHLKLRAPTNHPDELLQAILRIFSKQKTLPGSEVKFCAIR